MDWPCIFCWTVLIVCLHCQHDTCILEFCLLSRVTRFLHTTLANLQTLGFEFHLKSLLCAFNRRSVTQVVALLFFLLHTVDETQPGRNSCPQVATLGFQFKLYHVMVPFSFLRDNHSRFVVI